MENETMNNLIFIGIPLDTVIVSGITSEATVQVTATNGVIVIERCDDNHKDICECDCLCDECRAKLAGSEDE